MGRLVLGELAHKRVFAGESGAGVSPGVSRGEHHDKADTHYAARAMGTMRESGAVSGVTQNSIFRQSQPLDLNDTITEADSDGPAGFAEAAQQTYAHNLDDHSSSHVYNFYQTNITTISHTFQGIAARIVAWEENFFDSHCRSSRSDFHDIDHNFDLDPDHNLENFDHCNDHGTVDHSDLPYRIDLPWSIGRLAHNDLHVRTDLLCHTGPLDVGYHICEYWL